MSSSPRFSSALAGRNGATAATFAFMVLLVLLRLRRRFGLSELSGVGATCPNSEAKAFGGYGKSPTLITFRGEVQGVETRVGRVTLRLHGSCCQAVIRMGQSGSLRSPLSNIWRSGDIRVADR